MEQNNQAFNRKAANLVPADLPPVFPIHVEQSSFSLPDFSDACQPQPGHAQADSSMTAGPSVTGHRSTLPTETRLLFQKEKSSPAAARTPELRNRSAVAGRVEAGTVNNPAEPSANRQDWQAADLGELDSIFADATPPVGSGAWSAVEQELPQGLPEFIEEPDFHAEKGTGESLAVLPVATTPFDESTIELPAALAEDRSEPAAQPATQSAASSPEDFAEFGLPSQMPADRIRLAHRAAEARVNCEKLIQGLMHRKVDGQAMVCLFCDVDSPLRAGQVTLAVARELAQTSQKRVLVIDSDLEAGVLTQRLQQTETAGTREWMRAMYPWTRLVHETDLTGVSLMTVGKQRLRFSGSSPFVEDVCRKTLGELAETFGYVLVTTGTAFDNSLHLWRWLCDGTVAVLDPEWSSRSICQAAVKELNLAGCRVMGCLTTVSTPVAYNTTGQRAA